MGLSGKIMDCVGDLMWIQSQYGQVVYLKAHYVQIQAKPSKGHQKNLPR